MANKLESFFISTNTNLEQIILCNNIDSGNLTKKAKPSVLFRQNRWTKRGIAVVPTKFGISFTAAFLNQVCSSHTSDAAY